MDTEMEIVEVINEMLGEMIEKILEKGKDENPQIKVMYLNTKIEKMSKEILDKMMKDEIKEQKIEKIIKAQETFFNVMKAILGDDTNE